MRKIRVSGIDWIGTIPQDWQLSKIGSLYTQRNEKVSDKDYQPLSVTMQGILPQLATAAKTNDGDNRKLVRVGDFAINSRSDRRGSCGISPLDGSVSLINIILTPRTAMHPGYYNWLFHTTLFADEFYKWGHGIVADLWTTRWQEMKSITVPVPEYAEQERIAAFLDAECAEIDAVLEKTRASIEEYKKLKQAIITQAVTKGIRGDRPMKDSGIEWIGDIPESWEVSSVRYIGQLQNGISKGGEFFGKGFPFVSYGDVYKNYELPHSVSGLIDTTEDERATYSVEYGDIFFTRTSETIEEVGFSCVCKRSIPNATFAGFIIRLRPFCTDEKILTDYAKYYFRGEHIRAYLVKEMNLVTRASLGQTLLKGMSVIVPPKSVQKEIAEYLDDKCADIDALVAKKQQYLTEIENYKKSLIYEYVTGKKEVV